MAAKNPPDIYDKRIRRADHLITAYPFAREILGFYRYLADAQAALFRRLASHKMPIPEALSPSGRENLDIEWFLSQFNEFLVVIATHGPAALAESARQLGIVSQGTRADLLQEYWKAGQDGHHDAVRHFPARAFLQPYAERITSQISAAQLPAGGSRCPLCDSRPLLGVLRQEGDGGKRYLMCSFCLREWEFRRILCATCGEEAEANLPVYAAEQLPYIRTETCDTCKFYLRTIDLTKDGNAVPLVDDLAALPLALWAAEHGYTRAQPNLLGT